MSPILSESVRRIPENRLRKAKPRILAIVCAHNEGRHLAQCLQSLIKQTRPPDEVVVVNDRSSDNTGEIADIYGRAYPQMKVIHRRGKTLIEHMTEMSKAFNEGLKIADRWDFLARIDADMILDSGYFQAILTAFGKDERLGIAGGQTMGDSSREVRGGNRVFRRECWTEISDHGYMPIMDAEDTYLTFKARSKAWGVRLVEGAKSVHLRPIGRWPLRKVLYQRFKIGFTSYRFGYHPLFLLGRAVRISLNEGPLFIAIIPVLVGWICAWMARVKKIEPNLRAYIRNYQRIRICRHLR